MASDKRVKHLCDFCNDPNPTWNYPCRTFVVVGVPNVESLDSWLACESCHRLIQRSDWAGLAKRTAEQLGWTEQWVMEIHRQFREHREGEPSRYGTG